MALVIVLTMVLSSFSMVFAGTDEPSSWANEFVENAKSRGKLTEDGRMFSDYQTSITRKDFAYLGVMIYEEITGKSATVLGEAFTDSTDDYVLKARALNIVSGVGNNAYDPSRNITRQELAILFINIFKSAGVSYDTTKGAEFADDATIASWAKESVYLARANNLVSGVGGNKYDPLNGATIEQSLIMYIRAVEKFTNAPITEGEYGTAPTLAELDAKFNIPTGFGVVNTMQTNGLYVLSGSYSGEKVSADISTDWSDPNMDEYSLKQGIGFEAKGTFLNKSLELGVDEQTYNDFYEIPKQPLINVQGYERAHIETIFDTVVAGTKGATLGPVVEGTAKGSMYLVYPSHVIKVSADPMDAYFYMTIYPVNDSWIQENFQGILDLSTTVDYR